jgi:hypothetical protein
MSQHKTTRVAFDGRARKAWNLFIRDGDRIFQIVCESTQSAAEHNAGMYIFIKARANCARSMLDALVQRRRALLSGHDCRHRVIPLANLFQRGVSIVHLSF